MNDNKTQGPPEKCIHTSTKENSMLYVRTASNYTSQVEYKLQYSTIQTDFRGDVVNISNTTAEEGLKVYETFRIFPLAHHKWYHAYQTCHKAV